MWHIEFEPLLPFSALIACVVLAVLVAAFLIFRKIRGSLLRTLALTLALLALFNPVLVEEQRNPLESVAAIIVDDSASQSMGERTAQTDKALEQLEARLAGIPDLSVRVVRTEGDGSRHGGTALFAALKDTLQDVPPDRVAGAFFITDGEIHDVPIEAGKLGFSAPVHGLITGTDDEFDLQLELLDAPRYGIVDEERTVRFKLNTTDIRRAREIEVIARLNGEEVGRQRVPVDTESEFTFTLDRGGSNVLEIEADRLAAELTEVNNKAVVTIQGIRENLRVLLVSGEPHPGERTWRNLLKSDGMVDLVHFTILRPPEKQDGTPINQLSLIAFPTRELFAQKINEFDLIIFDRYKRRNVLPVLYFDNIARYVENGGAVLIAAGPDYAEVGSIYDTPLAAILPAAPTGEVYQAPFHAKVTETGFRHPVTRDLEGAGTLETETPDWARWFRSVDVEAEVAGDVVMKGADDRPLVVLNRESEGRVALMLSDHAWLWARGYDGGGPHIQLLRRLGHWLMKEPDLEEETLRGFASEADLIIERQTMSEDANSVEITQPDGSTITVELEEVESGLWRGKVADAAPGLYQLDDTSLQSLAHIGPQNPREYQSVVSTLEKLQPISAQTKGLVKRVGESVSLPRLVALNGVEAESTRPLSGRDWMGLRMTNASVLTGINRLPLFAGLLGFALLIGAFATMWYREGR